MMINYKLKYQDKGASILENILANRGLTIEQASDIVNPKESCIQDPFDFRNMKKSINTLKKRSNL